MSALRVTLILIYIVACSSPHNNPLIEIQTSLGDIEVELYPTQAPKSVAAFLSYVDSGFYKNATFYRVLNTENQPSDAFKSELIQGGLWGTGRRNNLPGIPHESTQQTNILHKNGVISLARLAPGTATTEFFICIGDQPGYDYGGENNEDGQGYAAFGRVLKGMDIVTRIYNRPETDQYFTPRIPIYNIRKK
ncbi:MAG TPA: peptidylprolyl isomerase [Chitinophagaceae bacterium]|nr:peptidylprolyl isomerase [Chitinophagaceae bacterium]